ncbi:hypothetical protein AQUCO_04700093v1 [Aquilegia coerulea]|uniref:WRC domain-containing protein n=1 Tax=Aquilegia coerulea TaxID=218851 RepID=A0A2G5CKY5_AQUCA|nr:hypothetical protein AQUCO_04700093v1 [Aquilegia coerulea]
MIESNGVDVDSIPADELRCSRNDGKGWRCKGFRFQDKLHCEKHYIYELNRRINPNNINTNKKKKAIKFEDKRLGNKRKRNRGTWGFSDSSEEEEEEDDDDDDDMEDQEEEVRVMEKSNKNIKIKRVSEIKTCEEYTISELVSTLQTSFRSKDFEEVEGILKMREEKMIMDKEDAEKNAIQLKNLLGVSGANCAMLSNQLHENKKEITAVEGKLEKLESEKIDIENELQRYKRISEEFKERVIHLEEEQRNVCEREKHSNERINVLKQINTDERERLIKVKTENIELQSAKRRAEYELQLWMERFKELDIQALLESHVSQMGYVQPICLSTQGPYAEDAKKSENKQTDYGLARACSSIVKVKEEAVECGGRFYASANPKTVCYSSAKECGVAKYAESDVQYGRKGGVQMVLQPDDSLHKMLSSSKLGITNTDTKMGTRPDEILSKVLERTCLKETQHSGSGCNGESFSTVMRNQNYGSSKEASSMDPETALDGITKFLYAIRKAKNKT